MSTIFHVKDYEALIREVLQRDGEIRIYPYGTSMRPLLREELDSVCLRRVKGSLQVNDLIFYQRADASYVLHRIIGKESEGLVLCGDHQCIPEHGVQEEAVIARVSRIFRGEHEVNQQGLGYRLYLKLWSFLTLRRGIFKILRWIKHTCVWFI